ncbi:DUF4810 domain-containing protein [Paludibacterium paludis]|uniref:DUF4810 domain-containing protein n=1 Tax=Paludibacterium paludis TaxID=1225769 RepID=A0A918NWG1_9NEIS|nr:DUF4810 domain-containing protein [Paludibacterium paludis]GGY02736.1 DUF4810 domain-containing protein [Paludibacterium paludis]
MGFSAESKRNAAIVALSAWLTACATDPPPLYQWGNYQTQIYEYFKANGKTRRAQLATLESDLRQLRADGKTPPPGFHAHLGLLYASLGNYEQSSRQFGREKTLFPESAPFMDALIEQSRR